MRAGSFHCALDTLPDTFTSSPRRQTRIVPGPPRPRRVCPLRGPLPVPDRARDDARAVTLQPSAFLIRRGKSVNATTIPRERNLASFPPIAFGVGAFESYAVAGHEIGYAR